MDAQLIENTADIAVLQTEVKMLKDELTKINGKLDDLLALRNKGVGAFWIASSLFGVFITAAYEWVKAHMA